MLMSMQFGELHRTVSRLDLVTYRNMMKHKVCVWPGLVETEKLFSKLYVPVLLPLVV